MKYINHPFKEAVKKLIEDHFAPSIAKRFEMEFEVNLMANDLDKGLQRQRMDNNLILQVMYVKPGGIAIYICDLYSWMSRKQTEYKLLRYITDKVKSGEIGEDWDDKGTSRIVLKGDLETREEVNNET